MTTKGFGKEPIKKTPSPNAQKRQAAAKKLDEAKAEGLPQFLIFIRPPDKPKTPQNWMPVGEIAVKRSSAINYAIFANEAELKKGALRLYPKLIKFKTEFEYGYRLKGDLYKDEPISEAVRPAPNPFQSLITRIRSWFQRPTPAPQKSSPKRGKKS